MIRQTSAILIVLMTLLAVCSCDPLGKPSLDPSFGVRVTDGKLRIWTGSPCNGTTGVDLTFDMSHDSEATLQLRTPATALRQTSPATGTEAAQGLDPGVAVEYITVGGPYPGLEITKALPLDFDWQRTKSLFVGIEGPPTAWGTTTDLTKALAESAQHPTDAYWFQGVGWLTPTDVVAQNGKTFLTLCTPDPS
ncbi:hypothetical protein [Mycolicibacterium houstonense]|uniref:hypothetical protein n=1 Tax=Mycolicibacterium houstonense TaxID=146021 RepID=UPI003F9E3E5D